MRILDLFCGAGGAAMGYHRAGFEVVGVDIEPQPHYPFAFYQADALAWFRRHVRLFLDGRNSFQVDAIHASPPCQAFTAYNRARPGNEQRHPNLIDETRQHLNAVGLPWVIENVEGASLKDPVMLCGSMFDPPLDVERHRLFETNWSLETPSWPCRHKLWDARYPASTNRRSGSRRTVAVGQWNVPEAVQRKAMDIDWMTVPELSQAIPPAYTEFIGSQLARVLGMEKVA